jgi:hypothetical protein
MIKPAWTRMRDSALQVIRLAGGLSAAGFALDDEHLWNPSLFITRIHLESRLAFLAAEGYAVLPLAEGLARLSAGTLPPRAVAITVDDDGTYDFHAVAYPVLKRLGVPVTLCVSTYHVFDRRPVFDVSFRYLLWKAWASGKADVRDPLAEDEPPMHTACERDQASSLVCETVWRERWSAERKHDWLGRSRFGPAARLSRTVAAFNSRGASGPDSGRTAPAAIRTG